LADKSIAINVAPNTDHTLPGGGLDGALPCHILEKHMLRRQLQLRPRISLALNDLIPGAEDRADVLLSGMPTFPPDADRKEVNRFGNGAGLVSARYTASLMERCAPRAERRHLRKYMVNVFARSSVNSDFRRQRALDRIVEMLQDFRRKCMIMLGPSNSDAGVPYMQESIT